MSISIAPLFRGCDRLWYSPLKLWAVSPTPALVPVFGFQTQYLVFRYLFSNMSLTDAPGRFISAKISSVCGWQNTWFRCNMWGIDSVGIFCFRYFNNTPVLQDRKLSSNTMSHWKKRGKKLLHSRASRCESQARRDLWSNLALDTAQKHCRNIFHSF